MKPITLTSAQLDHALGVSTMIDKYKWHNTGGNGQASSVWCRSSNHSHGATLHATINVMKYRCMVDTWIGSSIVDEGIPFATLAEAKEYADRFLSEVGQ